MELHTTERVLSCGRPSTPEGTIILNELGGPVTRTTARRPRTFGPDSGAIQAGSSDLVVPGCSEPVIVPPTQLIFFKDKGRTFQAIVRLTPEVTDDRRTEAYDILNSLRFVSAQRLERRRGGVRPPQEVRVLVLDSTGVDQAAATKANALRGLGYALAGIGTAPSQQGTTVGCRVGYEEEAPALATNVGPGTIVALFPASPPQLFGRDYDCIVTLGA